MPGPAGEHTGVEKAAIVLLALGDELGPRVLQKFSGTDIRRIMEQASAIGPLGKDELDRLVDEFAAQFARSLGLSIGFDKVRSLVEQTFPPDQLNSMLGGPGPLAPRLPVWSRFDKGSENVLVPYFLDEHPQTVAYALSKLNAALAAKCLAMLPGDLRSGVARRLLKLGQLHPDCAQLIEQRVEKDLLAHSEANAEEEGRQRLAALLNQVDRDVSEGIFQSLAADRPDEAKLLRKLIFSFEDIGKLGQPARLALFDKLQTEQVVAALRGMPADFKESVLSSLGARARRMVEAELANDNGQVTNEGLTARRAIADMVLAMAGRGELLLPDGAT